MSDGLIVVSRNLERGDLLAEDGRLVRVGRYAAGKRRRHLFEGRGGLVYEDGTWELDRDWIPNVLMDEGEKSIGNVYLGGQANPSKYGAILSATPADETKTMASGFTEAETPGTDGYNRQQFTNGLAGVDWTDDGLVSGDNRFSAAEKTYGPNTGAAWTLAAVAMVTVATGTAGLWIAYIATVVNSIPTNVAYKHIVRWTNQ